MSARLFVALTLDDGGRAGLAAWARAALGGREGVRLLDPDTLHMTLCFLGSLPLSAVDPIGAALAEVVGRAAGESGGAATDRAVGGSLVFSVAEVRWLPPRRPRVCALALHDSGGRAAALQAALSERLCAGGWYEPERRPWLPHVTVARMSRGGRPQAAVSSPPQLQAFPPTAVALMRSWPGSRYETLVRIEL